MNNVHSLVRFTILEFTPYCVICKLYDSEHIVQNCTVCSKEICNFTTDGYWTTSDGRICYDCRLIVRGFKFTRK